MYPVHELISRLQRLIKPLPVIAVLLIQGAAHAAESQLTLDHFSVVKLTVKAVPDARSTRTLGAQREGTGVVIDSSGLVMTIGYLVTEADTVELATADGRKFAPRARAEEVRRIHHCSAMFVRPPVLRPARPASNQDPRGDRHRCRLRLCDECLSALRRAQALPVGTSSADGSFHETADAVAEFDQTLIVGLFLSIPGRKETPSIQELTPTTRDRA